MVCHFAPPEDPDHIPIADDDIHSIEGTDLNDRKKLLCLQWNG